MDSHAGRLPELVSEIVPMSNTSTGLQTVLNGSCEDLSKQHKLPIDHSERGYHSRMKFY